MKTPSASFISQSDIDAELINHTRTQRKLRVFDFYQKKHNAKESIAFLKSEFGNSGHSHTFLDGRRGYINYVPGQGMMLCRYDPEQEIKITWNTLNKRLRTLIDARQYLTSEELSSLITQADIDALLVQDWKVSGRKQQIFEWYQAGLTDEQLEESLRSAYNLSPDIVPPRTSCNFTLNDGASGYAYYVAAGVRIENHANGAWREVSYKELSQHIRALIEAGQYLTPEERTTTVEQPVPKPPAPTVQQQTMPTAPQTAIDNALREWNGDLESLRRVAAHMETHARDKGTAAFLRVEYGDDLPAFPITGEGVAQDIPWTKVQRRLAQLIQQGAFLPVEEQEAPERSLGPSPSVREIFEHYFPIVKELVLSDVPYQNACKNSDRQNAYLEGGEAVKRAISTIEDANFFRLYYDLTGFHNNLHQQVLDETYPVLAQAPGIAQQERPADAPAQEDDATYRLLSRLCSDCEYFLGAGQGAEKHLWAGSVKAQIAKMWELYDSLLEKPEWLTVQDIDAHERQMTGLESESPAPAEPPYKVALFTPEDAAPATENFRITDDALGVGTAKAKYRRNVEAIRTLQQIEDEGRTATTAEQETLSLYVGWGGLPDAFDQEKEAWATEYAELKGLLNPEEYTSARASTLNAHYTSPTVINEAVEHLGFSTGNILEPSCGVGNFFGLLPEDMEASKLYGVELDNISGRIAQQLYPKASITVRGFEKTNFPDGFFDMAIGNVPFGGYKVVDSRYDKYNFFIHDYFLAKAIDKVRPGGVLAFITSGGTMDKKDRRAREYLAERCDLLGAIRLPNNAFVANAGTDRTADILFLQKLDAPRQLGAEPLLWVQADTLLEQGHTNDKGETRHNFVTVNRYFQAHPEMVLGDLKIVSGSFGPQLTCQPLPDADLAQQLSQVVGYIHGQITEAELPNLGEREETDSSIPADANVNNYSYTIVDGEVYYRENSRMVKPELNATARARVKGMVELRDCMRELINLQVDEFTDEAIIRQQAKLEVLYDTFTSKYGLINDRGNALAFADDSSYYLLCSLEVLDDDGKMERKSDIFTKRTIKKHEAVTSVDTASEALTVSIAEMARVDMPYMEKLSGKTEDVGNVIYRHRLL